MPNIILRNFTRLLRAGLFADKVEIEPMSVWKWRRAYQYALMHGVTIETYDGIMACEEQFFLMIPDDLKTEWQQSAKRAKMDYQNSEAPTLSYQEAILDFSNHALTDGLSLQALINLATLLKTQDAHTDFAELQSWIARHYMRRITNLAANLLVQLFDLKSEAIPFFLKSMPEKKIEEVITDMFRMTNAARSDWYFQQGKDIFVHTSNASAMYWQVQRSLRYFRYVPTESVKTFVSSFAHSLSHIEE